MMWTCNRGDPVGRDARLHLLAVSQKRCDGNISVHIKNRIFKSIVYSEAINIALILGLVSIHKRINGFLVYLIKSMF